VRSLGHRGLALGTAAAALLNAGVLLLLLRSRLRGMEGRRLLLATTKISIAAVAMGVAGYYSERMLHIPFAGDAVAVQAVRVFGAIGIASGVLAMCAHLLKIEEFSQLRRRVLPI
jgi:putative peptidoglycan lipid II flippase